MKHIKRIDTVFVPVLDVERARDWYENMFNFKVVYRSEDGQYIGFRFNHPGPLQTGLTLYKSNHIPELGHIAFNFYSADVDADHRKLKASGVEVTDIHAEDGMRYFDFKDPDGNWIGVVTF